MFKTNAIDSVANEYVDEDIGGGVPGTRLEAADRNIVQDELVNAVQGSGQAIDPTGVDRVQLSLSLTLAGLLSGYGIDSGVANVYDVAPVNTAADQPTAYSQINGAGVTFIPLVINTGTSTLDYAGLGAKPIVSLTGDPLVAGDINSIVSVLWDNSADNWVKLTTSEDIVAELKKIGNFVFDPQRMPWSVGFENKMGTGLGPAAISELNAAAGWAVLASAGATAQVSVDDTFTTILDIVSGAGVVTNFILPGVNASGNIVTLKITLDGVVFTVAFTASNAADRFASGMFEDISVSNYASGFATWGTLPQTSLATRLIDSSHTVYGLVTPSNSLALSRNLRFESSLKVEMKCSDVSTLTFRDYCAVIYILDQY